MLSLTFNIPDIQCRRRRTKPGDGFDNDCDGKIDEEILDGRDNDGDGKVDEDLQLVIYITLTPCVILLDKTRIYIALCQIPKSEFRLANTDAEFQSWNSSFNLIA